MSAPRKMPMPDAFKGMIEAQPHVTTAQWSARFGVTGTAIRSTAKAAGIKIKRAPHWRKGHVGIRLTADHVAVADGIVSTAAHRLTDFRMTVESADDVAIIDAAISGLDDLSTTFRSGDTAFLSGNNEETP